MVYGRHVRSESGESLNGTLDFEDFLQHVTGVQVHLAVLNSIQTFSQTI